MLSRLIRLTPIKRVNNPIIQYSTFSFIETNSKKSKQPLNMLPKNVPSPAQFQLSLELSKLQQLASNNLGALNKMTNDHLIELASVAIQSIDYQLSKHSDVEPHVIYRELGEYIHSITSIIFQDVNRSRNLGKEEVKALLNSLRILPRYARSNEAVKIDQWIEFIFNNHHYQEGYDQEMVHYLITLTINSPNASSLYPKLVKYIIRDNFRLKEETALYLIYRLSYYHHLETMNSFYNHILTNHPELLTKKFYHELIKGNCIHKNMEFAESLIQRMKENKIAIDYSIYIALIHGYGSLGNYSKLIETSNELIASNTKMPRTEAPIELVIKYLSKSPDNRSLIQELIQNNQKETPSLDSFNMMVQYHILQEDPTSAYTVLDQIKASGLIPNTNSFEPIVSYYVKNNNLKEAKQVLSYIKNTLEAIPKGQANQKTKIGKIIFNRLIHLSCQKDQPKFAHHLINQAKSLKLRLTPATFTPLMEYYRRNGVYTEVFKLYKDLNDRYRFNFNIFAFDIYLKALYDSNQMDIALKHFFDMVRQGQHQIQDQDVFTNAFGVAQCGSFQDLINFLNHPILLSKLKPSTEWYNWGIRGFFDKSKLEDIRALLDSNAFQFNATTLALLCQGYFDLQKYDEVITNFERFIQRPDFDGTLVDETLAPVLESYFRTEKYEELVKTFEVYYLQSISLNLDIALAKLYLESVRHVSGEDAMKNASHTIQTAYPDIDTQNLPL